jgi:hypothetical protein
MSRTSPTGINLRKIAQQASPAELEFIGFISWLNICGLKAFSTTNKTYSAAPSGFAPLIKTNPALYLNLETTFKQTLLEWHAKPTRQNLAWLKPLPQKPIQTVIIQDRTKSEGATKAIFARQITLKSENILLTDCVTTEYNSKLLELRIDPDHPLAYLLSGFSETENQTVPAKDITDISPDNPENWRLPISNILWTVANTMLLNSIHG